MIDLSYQAREEIFAQIKHIRASIRNLKEKEHSLNQILRFVDSSDDLLTWVKSKRCKRVTDHAVVRYLERVWGFDMDFIRCQVLPAYLIQRCCESDNERVPVNNYAGEYSHSIICHQGTVVTTVKKRPGQ